MTDTLEKLLREVAISATGAGVFDGVKIEHGRLAAKASGAAGDAAYRVDADSGVLWVSLVMADRWLSGSIELDLIHTGDKLTELIEEELVELECPRKVTFEHFRSEDRLFTFRTPIPVDLKRLERPEERQAGAQVVTAFLLAYEACFRNLGDMNASDE